MDTEYWEVKGSVINDPPLILQYDDSILRSIS